jgi:hypothetical protein
MQLLHVQAQFVDRAWRDGASELGKACDTSGGEITGDQLKMILARGERTLIRMDDEGKTVGWGVFRIDQLPNMRVFFITDLVAPNCGFERFWGHVKELASSLGCSRVRCAARPGQARLYRAKVGMRPVYEVLELET